MEWGVASRTRPNEEDSGDLHLVKIDVHQDTILYAVIDGIGKGRSAFLSALITRSILEQNSDQSLPELFRLCHEGLKRTKGVGLGLARIDRNQEKVTWAGFGTVEAMLISRRGTQTLGARRLFSQAGCLGGGNELPEPKFDVQAIQKQDLLVLKTEGVQGLNTEAMDLNRSSQEVAQHLIAQFWTAKDDGLVLVSRPLG